MHHLSVEDLYALHTIFQKVDIEAKILNAMQTKNMNENSLETKPLFGKRSLIFGFAIRMDELSEKMQHAYESLCDDPKSIVMQLQPLSTVDTANLLRCVWSGIEVDKEVVDLVYSRCLGNPLFTKELAQDMDNNGVVRISSKTNHFSVHKDKLPEKSKTPVNTVGSAEKESGSKASDMNMKVILSPSIHQRTLNLPETMKGLLRIRLDRMDAPLQSILKVLSVFAVPMEPLCLANIPSLSRKLIRYFANQTGWTGQAQDKRHLSRYMLDTRGSFKSISSSESEIGLAQAQKIRSKLSLSKMSGIREDETSEQPLSTTQILENCLKYLTRLGFLLEIEPNHEKRDEVDFEASSVSNQAAQDATLSSIGNTNGGEPIIQTEERVTANEGKVMQNLKDVPQAMGSQPALPSTNQECISASSASKANQNSCQPIKESNNQQNNPRWRRAASLTGIAPALSTSYMFLSEDFRQVVYCAMPLSERQLLHREVCEWYEQQKAMIVQEMGSLKKRGSERRNNIGVFARRRSSDAINALLCEKSELERSQVARLHVLIANHARLGSNHVQATENYENAALLVQQSWQLESALEYYDKCFEIVSEMEELVRRQANRRKETKGLFGSSKSKQMRFSTSSNASTSKVTQQNSIKVSGGVKSTDTIPDSDVNNANKQAMTRQSTVSQIQNSESNSTMLVDVSTLRGKWHVQKAVIYMWMGMFDKTCEELEQALMLLRPRKQQETTLTLRRYICLEPGSCLCKSNAVIDVVEPTSLQQIPVPELVQSKRQHTRAHIRRNSIDESNANSGSSFVQRMQLKKMASNAKLHQEVQLCATRKEYYALAERTLREVQFR